MKESINSTESAKVTADKNQIRQKIRELKEQLSQAQKQKEADLVFHRVELLPEFQEAKTILVYWSNSDELPTHAFIEKWSCEKEILLPSIQDDDITPKRFHLSQKMRKGLLGIWEPDTTENFTGAIDLVIVPGIAYDIKKNRLGRGKGYYDRFLEQIETVKWGVGFDFQLLPSIPTYQNDISMDKIITATHIIA